MSMALASSGRDIRIGIAGWSLRREHLEFFPAEGSHLQRYAATFGGVEINSSFYRPHRPATYARWAQSVPADFRFAVKLPKAVTHTRRLVDCEEPLQRFLGEATALGDRLGPLLVQLPPSLAFDAATVTAFFATLRRRFAGLLACEPRHRTWFAADVDKRLRDFQVARVAADPAMVPEAAQPGGWDGFSYWRLHGSPHMYYSAYAAADLQTLAGRLRRRRGPAWCIFDNTARGAATSDALAFKALIAGA
jgi:uncharacterized protein YecE (DUF72 family)